MIDSDMIFTIVRTFPESILVILAGVMLLNVNKDSIYILKQGLILGIVVTVIRMLPINFGIHTVLGMISIGVILFNIYKESLIKPIIATCEIWISIALSEAIYMSIAIGIFKIDFEMLIVNRGLKGAIITLPSLLIFLSIIFAFKKLQQKIGEIKKINDFKVE